MRVDIVMDIDDEVVEDIERIYECGVEDWIQDLVNYNIERRGLDDPVQDIE